MKFGLDPILGLFPGLGDVIGLVLSLYLIWIASRMHVPEQKIKLMLRNVLVDFAIGVVPFVGAVGDFFFRANAKNLQILKEHRVLVREAVVLP